MTCSTAAEPAGLVPQGPALAGTAAAGDDSEDAVDDREDADVDADETADGERATGVSPLQLDTTAIATTMSHTGHRRTHIVSSLLTHRPVSAATTGANSWACAPGSTVYE
jgi:hypothetical protein